MSTDFTFTGEAPSQPDPGYELGNGEDFEASLAQLGPRKCEETNQQGLSCGAPPLRPETLLDLAPARPELVDPGTGLVRILCSRHAGIAPEPQPVKAGQASGQARRKRKEELAEDFTSQLAQAFDENREDIIKGWIERAKGTQAVRYLKDGEEIVYDLPPDTKSTDRYLDRILGKPTQPVTLDPGPALAGELKTRQARDQYKAQLLEQHPELAGALGLPASPLALPLAGQASPDPS